MMLKRILKKSKLLVSLVQRSRSFVCRAKKKKIAKKIARNINRHINSDSIVHLMFNDKFLKPYVDFLNKYFNSQKHIILCKRWFDKYPFPEGENVFEIKSFDYIDLMRAKKIICHSVFDHEIIEKFYQEQQLLNKTCCVVWGGDFTSRKKDISQSKDIFVLGNFSQYIGGIDEPIVRKMYNISDKQIFFRSVRYIFPLNKNILDNVAPTKKNYIQIQLGQSAQESILDSMDLLYKFKDENIMIVVILSYGGDGVLENEIIKKGIALFGDKFKYIDNYMSPEDYAKHIANNNILIINDDHQTAFGNTTAHLYLGKKVFIRSDIPTGDFLLDNYDIHVYPTENINKLSFKEFTENPFAQSNRNNSLSFFDTNCIAKEWQKVFES